MRIFINDKPVILVHPAKFEKASFYDVKINALKEEIIPEKLNNNVLIKNVNEATLGDIIQLLNQNMFVNFNSLTIVVTDEIHIKTFVKKFYTVIEAAGGIVLKKRKILMIYRLRKWDFPKGKVNKKETSEEAAVREVEEECNIRVKLGSKIGTTYHTYFFNGDQIMKKTRWYEMKLLDDSNMKPQTNENIEEVRWMNQKEAYHAISESYASLQHLFRIYFNKKKLQIVR